MDVHILDTLLVLKKKTPKRKLNTKKLYKTQPNSLANC